MLAAAFALVGCGSETTSFRATDRTDGTGRTPAAAVYELRNTHVRVWSNGGYISNTEEPMTHVAFEIDNRGSRPIAFDGDALQLALFDRDGAPLPPAAFVTVTPLGPARVPIATGATTLEAYFRLSVRPRVVDHMQLRWSIQIDDQTNRQLTTFARDDDGPVAEPPRREAPAGS